MDDGFYKVRVYLTWYDKDGNATKYGYGTRKVGGDPSMQHISTATELALTEAQYDMKGTD